MFCHTDKLWNVTSWGKKVLVFCGDAWSCLFSICQYAIILLLRILTLLFLQMGASKNSNSTSLGDIEDLIHNFMIIMLEHSMRQKDGWKVISSNLRHLLPLWNFSGLLHIVISLLCIIISMLIPCLFVQWFVEHIMLFVVFDWMAAALEPSFSYQVKLMLTLVEVDMKYWYFFEILEVCIKSQYFEMLKIMECASQQKSQISLKVVVQINVTHRGRWIVWYALSNNCWDCIYLDCWCWGTYTICIRVDSFYILHSPAVIVGIFSLP